MSVHVHVSAYISLGIGWLLSFIFHSHSHNLYFLPYISPWLSSNASAYGKYMTNNNGNIHLNLHVYWGLTIALHSLLLRCRSFSFFPFFYFIICYYIFSFPFPLVANIRKVWRLKQHNIPMLLRMKVNEWVNEWLTECL